MAVKLITLRFAVNAAASNPGNTAGAGRLQPVLSEFLGLR